MSAFPAFVYKILDNSPGDLPLPHKLPATALDAHDGFIHLSDAAQTPKTAGLFFKEHTALWLLKVSTRAVQDDGAELRWADGWPGCVHIHGDGRRLGAGIVVDVNHCERAEGQSWDDAMGKKLGDWLVD